MEGPNLGFWRQYKSESESARIQSTFCFLQVTKNPFFFVHGLYIIVICIPHQPFQFLNPFFPVSK